MPKRPRPHELETVSRLAFQQSLPQNWLFRDVDPDYGIDGVVELFDNDRVATGDWFLVQLKSTDQKDLKPALCISFKIETVRYYNSLILPLLIVLYHAPSSQIYANWYKSSQAIGQQSTVTVRLSVDDLWTMDRMADVRSKLKEVRNLHSEAKRREAISPYYAEKAAIDLSAKAKPSGEKFDPSDLKIGTRVIHKVLGKGTVTDASPYYIFVRFESDDVDRKFNPGDIGEFLKA